MGESLEAKVTYDSTPWHVCPATGQQGALRFKGGARDGSEVTCPACGQRFVYRKPRASSTPTDQGGRTHF
jgi:predicted RNA-binding Zn-ribbon protein involved in translation (DUF1610 family)